MSKTILIVDENKDLGRLIQEWLTIVFPDYSIAAVASGLDAIDLFAKENPDILIMDINMAGINGIEATLQLKNEHPQTKVILLSIFDDDANRCSALFIGASGYIAKLKIHIDLIPLIKKLISSEVRESESSKH